MDTATLKVVAGGNETTVDPGRSYVIGRSKGADIVIDDSRVSRRHLMIESTNGGWSVTDISSNGTWLNGERMQAVNVEGETRFRLGTPTGPEVVVSEPVRRVNEQVTMLPDNPQYRLDPGPRRAAAAHGEMPTSLGGPSGGRDRAAAGGGTKNLEHQRRSSHQLYIGSMSLGRSLNNDIVLTDLLVSRHHAQLHIGDAKVEIVDQESANGTFVNGQRVNRASLYQGDIVAIGHHMLQLDGTTLVEFVDSGDVTFEAQGLNVFAGKKQLMHDVSFRLPARTLLAVVGPSGAGKSTLLNALTGFRPADGGTVSYAGRDLYSEYDELRRRIGYVPQEDLLHSTLTVRSALEFGAELRFPPDTTANERRTRVDEVLAELGLKEHAQTQVSRLSGGQRKRTSVALELLTKPSLLYLDEPTSGLDPGLDKSVMQSLRTLADDSRTVIVVTHSVAHLDVCDLVLVLAPGGYVAYFGPPQGALSYFGKPDFPDVFLALQATPGDEWGARFRSSNLFVPSSVGAPSAKQTPDDLPSIRQQSIIKQLSTLCRRYLAVVASDRSYLRLILAFPILLGLIPRVLPAKNGLNVVQGQPNRDAPTIVVVLILCACFMGMANAVREIVKERPIYRRERAIGLSLSAYLGSKVVVLTLITAPQAAVFTLIGIAGRTPKDSVVLGSSLIEVTLAVIVTAVCSAMVGLLVSTLVDNADKTMPLLVLLTMAQLVLAGGLVSVVGKAGLEQVSFIAPARWGFAAIGSSINLNAVQLAGVPGSGTAKADPRYDPTSTVYLEDLAGGLAVGLICVLIAAWLLKRADPKPVQRPVETAAPVSR